MKEISDRKLKDIKGGNIRSLFFGWGKNKFTKALNKLVKNNG